MRTIVTLVNYTCKSFIKLTPGHPGHPLHPSYPGHPSRLSHPGHLIHPFHPTYPSHPRIIVSQLVISKQQAELYELRQAVHVK